MKVILNPEQIEQILSDLTSRIVPDIPPRLNIPVIGVRSRGGGHKSPVEVEKMLAKESGSLFKYLRLCV